MIKISIITPAYNASAYIEKCIESVAKTNYDHRFIEHIIVDDGSTDNTAEICKKFVKKYKHIKFYSKPNGNWGSVINYVKNKKLVHGDYTIILDSDDQVMENSFNLVNKLNNDSDIVIGDYWDSNGKRKTVRIPSFLFIFKKNFIKKHKKHYLHHACIPCCTYFKTNLLYQINDLKEGLIYQDCVLYAELQLISHSIKHIKKAIGIYWNVRPNNTVTSKKTEKAIKSCLSNLYYYEKNDLVDLYVAHLVFDPTNMIKYVNDNHLSFHFKNKKINLKCYPWWQRIYIKLIYLFKIKKTIK